MSGLPSALTPSLDAMIVGRLCCCGGGGGGIVFWKKNELSAFKPVLWNFGRRSRPWQVVVKSIVLYYNLY
jgi:hypothetical protein